MPRAPPPRGWKPSSTRTARTKSTTSGCSPSRTAATPTRPSWRRLRRPPAARPMSATRRRSQMSTAKSRASSEMAHELITRRVLARELVVNAATSPLNVTVPVAVAAAAVLLHTMWLLPVALVAYVAMLVATFLDGDEAARVGQLTYDRARSKTRPRLDTSRFAPPIAQKLELAL